MSPNTGTKSGATAPLQVSKSGKELTADRVEPLSAVRQNLRTQIGGEDLDRKSAVRRTATEVAPDPGNPSSAQEVDQYAQASSETITAASESTGAAATATATTETVGGAAVASGAQVGGLSLGTIGAAAGVVGLAAAAGGGGGGSSSGSSSASNTVTPVTTNTPATNTPVATALPAPTVDSVTGNNSISGAETAAGVTVTGSGAAGAMLSIAWGNTTKSTTVDSAGRWSVLFAANEVPATPGSSAISASLTSAGQTSTVTTHSVTIEAPAPNAPSAPSIDAVSGDNMINASERTAGVTVSGAGVAQATVSISWGTTNKTATVDQAGHWTASFNASEIPASEGINTLTATQTRLGLTSTAAARALTVDTLAPAAPTVTASASGIVSGTTTAGNLLTLDFNADGVADATVPAAANGSFSFPTALTNNQTISVVAFDTAGNRSLASTLAAPAAPSIAAVSTDGLINGTERAAGVTVTGTGAAGADVTITWAGSSKTSTVDGSGNWTSSFSSAEIPTDGSSSISATVSRFSQTSKAATQSVTIDTVAPGTPTISVNSQGIVSGKTDAGNKLTIDSNGDGVADATVIAGSNGSFTFTTAFTSGQQLAVSSFDAAGNKSATAAASAPSTNFGSAAADVMTGTSGADLLIGGSGADQISGGMGNDRLFGGSAASVRNYQFEYWDLRGNNAVGLWDNGLTTGNIAFFDPSSGTAVLGWTLVDYLHIASRQFGSGGNTAIQWLGVPDNPATQLDEHLPPLYQIRRSTAADLYDTPDTTGNGGRYLLATAVNPADGGTEILQSVITNPNEAYALTIRTSNPDLSNNSIEVRWKGAELAVYDAITNTWSGTAPTVTANGTNHVNLTWNVTGQAGAGSSDLDIKVYSSLAVTAENQRSLRIDSVTLDGATTDGNDLLVGGGGQDILYGQAGDDTLYGGAAGAVDNSGNAFVYTMRTNNGNDVIKDFQVGTDRLTLIDLVDSHLGTGVWNATTNPDASRTPDSIRTVNGILGQAAGTTNDADNNLSFQDLMPLTSANQYLTLGSDGATNNVKITLHNAAGELGSIVLEGVQYGSGAGQYDTVQDLMGDGYHDQTILTPGGSPTQILFVTMEGYNTNLLV